jgi:hypothetical protein
MNRYGEWRNDRLVRIENELSDPTIPGLQMWHFRKFSSGRKEESWISRLIKFKWIWHARVKEVVTIFGSAVLLLELFVVWHFYVSKLF